MEVEWKEKGKKCTRLAKGKERDTVALDLDRLSFNRKAPLLLFSFALALSHSFGKRERGKSVGDS